MTRTEYTIKGIPSSFVYNNLKLLADKGAGEAKLFVGPKSKESEIDEFFSFNENYTYRFDKANMLEYLYQVKMEYVFQKINQYKEANINKWDEVFNEVAKKEDSDFVVNLEKYTDDNRYYLRSNDYLFKQLFRKVAVPKLTDLLFKKDDAKNVIIMYLQVNYDYKKDESAFDEENEGFEDVLIHNLWGLHIKNKNDALSEENPHICIGWSEMKDLKEVETDADIIKLYEQAYPDNTNNRSKGQNIRQIRRFIKDVNVGDYVIFAESEVFHIGRVESEYYYDDTENPNQDPDYVNNRRVTWLKKNVSRKDLSSRMHKSLATSMSIFGINDYRSAVVDILRGTYKKDDEINEIDEIYDELNYVSGFKNHFKRNRILFGAPGTGKSFILNKERSVLLGVGNETDYERVTFHPDYSYANFVGTYKPVMVKNKTDNDKKEISYDYVAGPFMRILVKALKSCMDGSNKPYLLIVEEINRANVAAVFGDVFQLLDRDEKNISEYSIATSNDMRTYLAEQLGVEESAVETIKIPDNMFIWATMNSADQGVFPMDTAFKRRWDFTYLGINSAAGNFSEEIKIRKYTLGKGANARLVSWNDLRIAINKTLSSENYNINEDKLLGPYFIAKSVLESDNDADFIDAFKNKVLMYLFDDAVKQRRKTFFEECSIIRYSEICEQFDDKGVFIFPQEISNKFTENPNETKAKGDNE